MVDEDYGSRVEKGLASASKGGTLLEKFAQKIGMTSDKQHTVIGTTKE